ncbi:MAG: Glycosyl transferase, group 1 [Candidatus Moranbacteria bacterium GW2011_GWF1_36_4]|nr:MAG: Glycosyl transferase, group 1 [Candidatus Moranbacteria bacterium GW2011_GWF1_36_4]
MDNKRIDGTRVYLLNLLKYFGKISPEDEFLIYHRKEFNPELTPKNFSNYKIKRITSPCFWTQTRFAAEVWKDNPDVLWMPMHNIPLIRKRKLKTVATIHDLAFKIFPESFPTKDLRQINFLTDIAIRNADKMIAISHSTKNDILKFYSQIDKRKIKVIHHGFDMELFQKEIPESKSAEVFSKFKIQNSKFILYVGAVQPRKNLETLIWAFEKYRNEQRKKINNGQQVKLVFAGSRAWMWERVIERVENSPFRDDIILTGRVDFLTLATLYRNAGLFVFPSLYEGFGIPVLEAMASKVPVICADNSSLREAGGEAAEYFHSFDPSELAEKIEKIFSDDEMRKSMIEKGIKQAENFSWERCARETLEWLKC